MGELRPCNDDTCHLHVETLLGLWPRDPALEPCFRCFSTAKPVVNMFAELETCKKRELHLDWTLKNLYGLCAIFFLYIYPCNWYEQQTPSKQQTDVCLTQNRPPLYVRSLNCQDFLLSLLYFSSFMSFRN